MRKGYDYVGISFLLAVFHKMKEVVALVRRYAPNSKIVLGGYGTVLGDDVLEPFSDFICRGEGVAFFRELLGEPPLEMPYRHPLIVSRMKVFSMPYSTTGMVFAGLGCPNGCDFCCTSHFFKRKHVRLLPTGRDIHDVIERYLAIDPGMAFVILDEDFLLNRKRAMEFRDCVVEAGKPLSIFAFSSVKAISQYTVEEIHEMGIDGFWIGYEGTRSGYDKQQGRPVAEIFREFRENGIAILASMIVGFDYQDAGVVAEELDGLLSLKPALAQFMILGMTPGTPFYRNVVDRGLMRPDLQEDSESYYHKCTGFSSMVKHPTMAPSEIENLQRRCFTEDFRRLGPSIFRVIETTFLGWRKLKDSPNQMLRKRAERFAATVRAAYPAFLAGELFNPTRETRQWMAGLGRDIYRELGTPSLKERLLSLATLAAAGWTWLALKLGLFQHPRPVRNAYRLDKAPRAVLHEWEDLARSLSIPGLAIRVELQHAREQVRLRLKGILRAADTEKLGQRIKERLGRGRAVLIIDLKELTCRDGSALRTLGRKLEAYRPRVRLSLPHLSTVHPELLLLSQVFGLVD